MIAPERILVVRLSSLGDVVATLPAYHRLRAGFGNARISWLVEAPFAPLVESLPGLDAVVTLRTRRWRRDPLSRTTREDLAAVVKRLRAIAPDLAIDFQGTIKSASAARLSGARERLGLGPGELRESLAAVWLTHRGRGDSTEEPRHAVERGLVLAEDALAACGLPTPPDVPPSFASHVPADPDEKIAAFVAELGPFALLQAGAGWVNKEWAPERFAELARILFEENGLRSVAVWGPGEESLARRVVELAGDSAMIAPTTTIPELASLALRASVVVGGDTGPIQLAAAVGAPTVAILGPTGSRRHRPFGPRVRSVEEPLACRPCERRYRSRKPCLDRITVRRVHAAVIELLT